VIEESAQEHCRYLLQDQRVSKSLKFRLCHTNREHEPSIIGEMFRPQALGTLEVTAVQPVTKVWTRPKRGPKLESVMYGGGETTNRDTNSHESGVAQT
jgi:hypothetical protein